MGIWSEPVCAFPEDAVVELSKIPPNARSRLANHNIGIYPESDEECDEECGKECGKECGDVKKDRLLSVMTWKDFIMGCCDTAKIWGYMIPEEIEAWESMFATLSASNPDVGVFEAHFYCNDESSFYYFSYNAKKNEKKKCMTMKKCSPYHVAFFVPIEDDSDSEYSYNMEIYKSKMDPSSKYRESHEDYFSTVNLVDNPLYRMLMRTYNL